MKDDYPVVRAEFWELARPLIREAIVNQQTKITL